MPQDLPISRCAQCADCPHDRSAISGTKLSDNFAHKGYPYGPFGMMPPAFVVPVPRHVQAPCKVLKVAAGDLHSLLLGEDGRAYSFGCAFEGRLGLGAAQHPVAGPAGSRAHVICAFEPGGL